METIRLEVYSQDSNMAVVKMPGRRFPGSVVQGDSLKFLAGTARYIFENLPKAKDDPEEELFYAAKELSELLQERLEHYESVLKQHGLELPID